MTEAQPQLQPRHLDVATPRAFRSYAIVDSLLMYWIMGATDGVSDVTWSDIPGERRPKTAAFISL